MAIIQHILCPTDFSNTAMKAVKYAEQLAMELDVQLTLLHAFDTPATFTLSGQEHPRDPRIEQQLNAVLSESQIKPKIQRKQHAGHAGEVICWMAQDLRCDLIVMGTHGRTGMSHLLFGSIAEHVLRHARCPVVTIRDRDPGEPPLPRPTVMPLPPPRFM
jgi:universal stress protein A